MYFSQLFTLHNNIGLDLDDTLTNTMEDGLEKLHKMGKLLQIRNIEEMRFFDWSADIYNDITKDDYLGFWGKHRLGDLPPYLKAQEGVQAFIKQGKKLSIITARNEIDHRDDTESWIKKFFPEIQDKNIHFANHLRMESVPKSEICKKYGITLMIDDAFHNAVDLVENNIACILLEKPWNKDKEFGHPLLYRAKDWNEIISYIH